MPLKGNYFHRTRKASDGAIDLGALLTMYEARESDRGEQPVDINSLL